MRDSSEIRILPWVDVAKAVCIVLVVLMHVEAQVAAMGWAGHEKVGAAWRIFDDFVRPMRMPTFFLVSGLLAAASMRRDDPRAGPRRYVRPLYLYLVWGAVFAMVLPANPAATGLPAVARLKAMLLLGSPAWFLFALGLFYLVARVTRDLPAAWVLAGAAALSAAGSIYAPDQALHAAKLLRCGFFFLAGVRLREPVIAFVEAASARRAALLAGLYVLGSGLSWRLGTYLLPVDILAVAASVTGLNVLQRHLGALMRPVQWVGRRTLFVYLLHFPLIGLLSLGAGVWTVPAALDSAWAAFLYPVATTLLIVPAALVLGPALARAGLGALFDLPGWHGRDPAPAGPPMHSRPA